jgi:hypothetical protein
MATGCTLPPCGEGEGGLIGPGIGAVALTPDHHFSQTVMTFFALLANSEKIGATAPNIGANCPSLTAIPAQLSWPCSF